MKKVEATWNSHGPAGQALPLTQVVTNAHVSMQCETHQYREVASSIMISINRDMTVAEREGIVKADVVNQTH